MELKCDDDKEQKIVNESVYESKPAVDGCLC
jgi:hypothetical protein